MTTPLVQGELAATHMANLGDSLLNDLFFCALSYVPKSISSLFLDPGHRGGSKQFYVPPKNVYLVCFVPHEYVVAA